MKVGGKRQKVVLFLLRTIEFHLRAVVVVVAVGVGVVDEVVVAVEVVGVVVNVVEVDILNMSSLSILFGKF